MLSCKEVSRLVSESLDRKLPFWQRVQMRIHLFMCRLCSGFRKDLGRLREAAREDVSVPDAKLSDEARQRIQSVLDNHDV